MQVVDTQKTAHKGSHKNLNAYTGLTQWFTQQLHIAGASLVRLIYWSVICWQRAPLALFQDTEPCLHHSNSQGWETQAPPGRLASIHSDWEKKTPGRRKGRAEDEVCGVEEWERWSTEMLNCQRAL